MSVRNFQTIRVPFDRVPGVSRLFLDYVRDWSSVAFLYGRSFTIESIASYARECPRPGRAELDRLCDALGAQQDRWGGRRHGVDKLRAGAVAVMTGQQPGLFTGPLYTALKAITAIKVARALEALGIAAVPVFWIASEDHDHEEIRWATVLDRDGVPRRIHVELAGDPAAPAGWTTYTEDVGTALTALFESLPESEFSAETRAMLESAYAPGVSPVNAFARVLTRLFSAFDLTLADPLDPELKRLAQPVLEEVVRGNGEVRAAVLQQSRAIVKAGYHEQVRTGESFTGLFSYEGQARRALKPDGLASGLALSPNVLARPVVQDSIFPTAAVVGGPAEIAYFAQAAAVYRTLGRPMPPVVPRISATLVEPRVSRAVESYGLDLMDAWRGREYLAQKAGRALEGAGQFDHVRQAVDVEMESLRPLLGAVDSTLIGSLETARQKMLHQVEALRSRYVHAEEKRNDVMDRRLDLIANTLYPEKKLQEREICAVSFLARYGPGAIERIESRLSLDAREHQFAGIE